MTSSNTWQFADMSKFNKKIEQNSPEKKLLDVTVYTTKMFIVYMRKIKGFLESKQTPLLPYL